MKNSNFFKLIEDEADEADELKKNETDLYELERKIEALVIKVGKKWFQEVIGQPGNDHRVKKKISSRFGEIEVHNNNRHSKSVSSFKTTPYFREILTLSGQALCYNGSESELSRLLGIDVNVMKVHRVTNYYGKLAETIETPQPEMPQPDECVYVQVDGSNIFTRQGWKEVKAGRIFFGKPGSKGCIKNSEYEAIIGTKEEFLAEFEKKLEGYQFLRERLIFVTDGATWIKNWIDDAFPEATQIPDYYHACEHLHEFANKYFAPSQEKIKKEWTDKQKKLLEKGQVQKVMSHISELPARARSNEERENLLQYYGNNMYRMDYEAYKNMGAGIIGSGAIEATHRNLIQKRLKLSGQRWTIPGAQNILNLRCLELSNHWDKVRALIKNDTAQRKVA